MPLYKQNEGLVWWADISIPGRRRLRRSTGETDERAAQRKHDEFKVELWNEKPELRGRTWGAAVEKWVDAQTRSDSELLSLAKFGRNYPDRMLADVTAASLDEALKFCKTPGTYMRYRAMFAAILTLSKVTLELEVRRDKKKKPRKWITEEQWDKLYLELPPHMRSMAEFAVCTGLRKANVLGLTWDRVDEARKIAWVEGEEMKADEAIAIPLAEDALKILAGLRARPREDTDDKAHVFLFRGQPMKTTKTAFMAACVRAGLGVYTGTPAKYSGFTWHGLRHTWATWHVQNGTPLEVLMKLGGWSDMRMVLNYAHFDAGHVARYAENRKPPL